MVISVVIGVFHQFNKFHLEQAIVISELFCAIVLFSSIFIKTISCINADWQLVGKAVLRAVVIDRGVKVLKGSV